MVARREEERALYKEGPMVATDLVLSKVEEREHAGSTERRDKAVENMILTVADPEDKSGYAYPHRVWPKTSPSNEEVNVSRPTGKNIKSSPCRISGPAPGF